MNKKWIVLPVTAFMMMGLVGCANNDKKFGVNNRNVRNNTQNVRYNPNNQDMNGRRNVNNDRLNDQNHLNDTPYVNDNNGRNNPYYNTNNTDFNTTDSNAINNPNNTNPNGTMNVDFWNNAKTMNTKSERLARKCAKIAAKQKNVKSAQTYVAGNTVFVTLNVKEGVNDSKTVDKVRSALKRQVKGKNFNIMSDLGSFDQMRNSNRGISENAPANRVF